MWFKQGQIEVECGDENGYGSGECGDDGGDFAVLADEFLHKAFSAWCAAVTCYVNTAILVDADRVGENLV